MEGFKNKQVLQATHHITNDLQTKYDFITDDLIKDIELNQLNARDAFKIISILKETSFFISQPNTIITIKDLESLKTLHWKVGDIVVYLHTFNAYKVLSMQALVLFHYKNEEIILYTDGTGEPLPIYFKELLSKFNCHIIKCNTTRYNSLMTINNIDEIVIASVDSFESCTEFCSENKLDEIKVCLVDTLKQLQLTENIHKELQFLKNKTEFKRELNTVIKQIALLGNCNQLANDYKNIIESENKTIDSNGEIEQADAKKNLMENLMEAVEKVDKKIRGKQGDEKTIMLQIETDFPEECNQIHKIFAGLDEFAGNDNRMNAIEMISNMLDLDFEDIKIFYEHKNRSKSEQGAETQLQETAKNDEDLILEQYNENIPLSPNAISSYRPLQQLLTSIGDLNNLPTDQVKQLETLYNRIMSIYSTSWIDKNARAIRKWAKEIKAEFKGKEHLSDENICAAIAACKRAYEIVSDGKMSLRDVQVLSILMFLLAGKGKFAEISTGEGKTIIIAALAVIKVLQGKNVDIITSNDVLAAEGANSSINFCYLFNAHTGHNNYSSNYKQGPRDCYNFDIVYGTMSNFQFDYLRDIFEGQDTRAGRLFQFVILDEVDCLTVDNGNYIAKLAQSFPGIESLRYAYIKIWVLLTKAEEAYMDNIRNDMNKETRKIEDEKERKQKAEEYLAARLKSMPNELKIELNKIAKDIISDITSFIPSHLLGYCESMWDKWIDNAIYAKYKCHENVAYVIKDLEKGRVVVPVDYNNTGMTLINTVWSNGLHQFIQLKHNLRVNADSLTAAFISNIGYIRLYNSNMFGLTGTLGSETEQKLLSSIYSLQYIRVPTFKEKQFEEYDGIVVADSEWDICVTLNAYMIAMQKRSVLIICKSISDAKLLAMNMDALLSFEDSKYWIKLRYYFDETNADVSGPMVGPCEIIIATNIAGRGTDFITTSDLESAGGLHVCIAFLPCNARVTNQAKGRTCRMGNRGTAQLIIKESDVADINYKMTDSTTMKDILNYRDNAEAEKLEHIRKFKLSSIMNQEALFKEFTETYRNLSKNNKKTPENLYLCMDLKERWAFWLYSQQLDNFSPELYQEFLAQADPALKGNVSFNPFYAVKQAEYFLENSDFEKALLILRKTLKIFKITKATTYIYPIYMKLFEAYICSGMAIRNRIFKALKQVCFINTDNLNNPDYKKHALDSLECAMTNISLEIDYIKKNILDCPDFQSILLHNSGVAERNKETNIFLNHLTSRFNALSAFRNNISNLIHELNDIDGDVTIHRLENYYNDLNCGILEEQKLRHSIDKKEIDELNNVGLSAMYLIREVFDVSNVVIQGTRVQILASATISAACLFFPPALAIGGVVSSVLLSEAIADLIFDLMSLGTTKVTIKQYMKTKLQSFLIAAFTFGLGYWAKNIAKLGEYVEKAVQRTTKLFEKCEWFAIIWQKLSSFKLVNIYYVVEFWIRRFTVVRDCYKRLQTNGCEKGVDFVGSLVREILFMKNVESILNSAKPYTLNLIMEQVRIFFEDKLLMLDLNAIKTTLKNETIEDDILNSYDIFNKTISKFVEPCAFWKVPDENFTLSSLNLNTEIESYANQMCQQINDLKLDTLTNDAPNSDTIIEEIVEAISNVIIDEMFVTIINLAYGKAMKARSTPLQFAVPRRETFLEIANAFKQLGLGWPATAKDVEDAYNRTKGVQQLDSSKYERISKVIADKEAKELAINFLQRTRFESEENLEGQLPKTDKRALKCISEERKLHIVVDNEALADSTHFGSGNGGESLNLSYNAPTAIAPGYYFLTGLVSALHYTTRNNGLYECLSLLLNARGIAVTPIELRLSAKKPTLRDLHYEAIDKSSSLFDHPHTVNMYQLINKNIILKQNKVSEHKRIER